MPPPPRDRLLGALCLALGVALLLSLLIIPAAAR